MIDITKGRYWDLPWSLVESCTRCSPGCDHCWALAIEKRFGKGYEDQVFAHDGRLSIPLKRRKPAVYSVWNDFFHGAIDHSFRCDAYKTMMRTDYRHTYLILTKRADFAANYAQSFNNIWHGLTVCNQAEADAKIPVFLQVPGKKFLSLEPLLGPIDITMALEEFQPLNPDLSRKPAPIDAVILGGETGPGARPMHPDWVRSIRDQCAAAGVPFFFKGWGEWFPEEMATDHQLTKQPRHERFYPSCVKPKKVIRHIIMACVGKRESGRLLDGRTHDELPWVTAP